MTRHGDEDSARDVAGLLRTSSHDGPAWQLDTDMILSQGRRAVRRRRLTVTTTMASVGVIVAVTALAVPNLVASGGDHRLVGGISSGVVAPTVVAPTEVAPTEVAPTEVAPTEVAPTEVSPTEEANTWAEAVEPLSAAEAVERCGEQLAESAPEVPLDEWRRPAEWQGHPVPEDEELYVGDDVYFEAGDVGANCIVPGTWRPDAPVDLTDEAPAEGDHDAILRRCSAVINVDLRQWNVAAAMADGVGGLAAMLTSPEADPHLARCQLQPSTWIAGRGPSVYLSRDRLSEIQSDPAQVDLRNAAALEVLQTCIEIGSPRCHGGLYTTMGVVSDDIASIEFRLPELRTTVTVPVDDGLFALRAVDGVVDSERGLPEILAYDEDGELVDRFVDPTR